MKKDVQETMPVHRPPRLVGDNLLKQSCPRRLIRSEELLGGDDRVLIDHNGKLYELRSLPGGRLILTGWRAAVPRVSFPVPVR